MLTKGLNDKTHDQEHALWESFRKGDPGTFLRLYDEYVDVLFSFGTNFTTDKELIKDCIHDLFLDLGKYRAQLSDTTSIRFYLMASLKRRIIREQKKTGALLSFDPAILPLVDKEESPAFEYIVIEQEKADDQNRILLQALKTLSNHQQRILFLRFNQELSYPEIADLLNISVESVRTMIYRSLKLLRAGLQKTDFTFHQLLFIYRSAGS